MLHNTLEQILSYILNTKLNFCDIIIGYKYNAERRFNRMKNPRVSNFITKLALKGTSLLALAAVSTNVNATCQFSIHQPKLPEGAKKLRKF